MRISQERRATLTLVVAEGGPPDEEVRAALESSGYRIESWDSTFGHKGGARRRRTRCELRWRGRPAEARTPAFICGLADRPGVVSLRWKG